QIEAVFVDQHLRMLQPHRPRLFGDRLKDLLAELALERRLIQPRELFAKLDAHDLTRHRETILGERACCGDGKRDRATEQSPPTATVAETTAIGRRLRLPRDAAPAL